MGSPPKERTDRLLLLPQPPPAGARRRSAWWFTAGVALTAAAVLWIGWQFWALHGEMERFRSRDHRMVELAGEIIHLDEVLTMSARMAAATLDPAWEDRYRRFEPQLDEAIQESLRLDPENVGGFVAQTDAANRRLVEMENRAFDLVRQKNQHEATAVLFSPEYEVQKRLYAEGVQKLTDTVKVRAHASMETQQGQAILIPAILVGVMTVLSMFWLALLRTSKRRAEAERRAMQATEQARRELEGRVAEATAHLAAANRRLEEEMVVRQRSEAALGERVKELACLQKVRDSLQAGLSVEQVCQSTVDHLAQGMQYPEIAAPGIVIDGRRFISGRSPEGLTHGLHADIAVAGIARGRLSVFYTEQRPFLLPEEQNLVDAIAKILSHWLDRLQAEEEIRQSEERFRSLFESSRDAMMIMEPPLWKFTAGNSAALEMFGVKNQEEFTSCGPWDVSPERQPDGRLTDEKARELIEAALGGGSHFFEWTHKRTDGEEFPVTVLLTRTQYAGKLVLQATVRDITEHKRMEHELRRLAVIVEQAAEGISVADMDGNLDFVNDAWARMHGYDSGAELVGKTLRVFHTDEQMKTAVESFNAALKRQGHNEGELGHVRRDGTTFTSQVSVVVLKDKQGKPYGLAAFAQDITERKRAEEAIRRSKSEAEHANAAKSAFLANMSHEIRTPMTAILGFAELIGNSIECCAACSEHMACATRVQNRGYIQVIRRNGEHLLCLINDILDLSKIEAGRMDMQRAPCSPVQIVEDVVSLMRVRAIEKGISLEARYKFPLPETTLSDPVRVRQILVNLVGNALKFCSHGGAEIAVRFTTEVHAGGSSIVFDVKDTGIGITPEQIGRLFHPFAQADASTTRQYGGTGLGLAISKRLAEALGGNIYVVSRPGEGSTFTLKLEAELPEPVRMLNGISEAARASCQPQPAPLACVELCGRVLLAEDGPDNQALVCAILRKAGAEVDVASNGRVAVEKALAAVAEATPYDVILMDMQMPEMDGYEATSQLRLAGYKGPIIAFTAHAMAEDRQKCIDAGCDDYATKPVDRMLLLHTLARYMVGARPGAAASADMEAGAEGAANSSSAAVVIYSTFRDDPEMADVLAEFIAQMPNRMAEMRRAAEVGQWDLLRRLAHQMKGAGGSYGYACLSDAARELESHAERKDAESVRLALAGLARMTGGILAGCPAACRSSEAAS